MPSSRVSFQIFARDDLELVARVTVEGALSGLHRSPFHGGGAVFSAADLESVVTKLRAIERPIVPARTAHALRLVHRAVCSAAERRIDAPASAGPAMSDPYGRRR